MASPTKIEINNAVSAVFNIIDTSEFTRIKGTRRDRLSAPEPRWFQDVDAMYQIESDDRAFLNPKAYSDIVEAVWPVRVACLSDPSEGALLSGTQMTTVDAKFARSVCSIVPRRIARIDHFRVQAAQSRNGAEFLSASVLVGLIGGKWVEISGKDLARNSSAKEALLVDQCASMMLSAALTQRYTWGVSISKPGTPSFMFACSPASIARLFRDRHVDEGCRRSRLVGWITDHWRSDYRNDADEIYVRKHFRGSDHFDWGEYSVRVRVSPYDIERDQDLRAERMIMGGQARRRAADRSAQLRTGNS